MYNEQHGIFHLEPLANIEELEELNIIGTEVELRCRTCSLKTRFSALWGEAMPGVIFKDRGGEE